MCTIERPLRAGLKYPLLLLEQDNGDGEGDGSHVSRVGQESSSPSDIFTTFLDRKSYVSKLSIDSQMVRMGSPDAVLIGPTL